MLWQLSCKWFRRRCRTARATGVVLAAGSLAFLAPATSHAAAAPVPKLAGYDIIYLGRGHFNRLSVATTIDGTRALMYVDTGGGGTILSEGRFGFLRSAATSKLPSGAPATISLNGGINAPVVTVHQFQIGQTQVGSFRVALVGPRYLYDISHRGGGDRQYDGILGENILRHFNAIIDCGRLALYLNTDPARKINLGPGIVAAGWTRVPMSNFGSDFTVPCEINGHTFRIAVDTGAPYTVLDADLVRLAGASMRDTRLRGGIIGTVARAERYAGIAGLRIGDYTAGYTPVFARDSLHSQVGKHEAESGSDRVIGLLGGDFLAANHAMIDIGDHTLFLKASGAPAAKP